MTRVVIICEGPTEEGFIKDCLAPHLVDHSVYATPQLLGRSPAQQGGGNVSVQRVVSHIRRVHRHGPLIAEQIGLEAMREACPGFRVWLSRLESLAAGS